MICKALRSASVYEERDLNDTKAPHPNEGKHTEHHWYNSSFISLLKQRFEEYNGHRFQEQSE